MSAERDRRRDARLAVRVAEAWIRLGRPGKADLAALGRVATDEALPARTRRRAAAVLARVALCAAS